METVTIKFLLYLTLSIGGQDIGSQLVGAFDNGEKCRAAGELITIEVQKRFHYLVEVDSADCQRVEPVTVTLSKIEED